MVSRTRSITACLRVLQAKHLSVIVAPSTDTGFTLACMNAPGEDFHGKRIFVGSMPCSRRIQYCSGTAQKHGSIARQAIGLPHLSALQPAKSWGDELGQTTCTSVMAGWVRAAWNSAMASS